MQDMNSYLDQQQFGNRKGLSTVHCLVDILHHLCLNSDKPKTTSTLILTDFSKAFDRINQNIAVKKLLSLNVNPSLVLWISDFLMGRRQCVRYNTAISEWTEISAGVPQGTKLGPIVFLAIINDASLDIVDPIRRFIYVDDLTLLECCDQRKDSNIQAAVTSLRDWSLRNQMRLNPQKCISMEVCFMRDAPPPSTVVLGDGVIAQQQSVKLLGVFIQQNLKWDQHVNEMLRKANGKLHMLRLLKHHNVPTSDLLTVFNSYIRPTVEYAVPVWNPGLTKEHVRKLENIQKRALKIILGREFTHYDDALALLNICTLVDRRKQICL